MARLLVWPWMVRSNGCALPGSRGTVADVGEDDRDDDEPGQSRAGWIIAVTLIVIVGGCSVLSQRGSRTTPSSDSGGVSKYTQTWSKPYGATTCDEWNDAMSSHEQFAAAADMLTGARNNGDGGSGLPPDELVIGFELDISQVCSVPATSATELLTDTAAAVYLVGRDQYRP